MIFIGGPRQVGKTTLAKTFLKSNKQYFSWDDLEDRTLIKSHRLDSSLRTIVLDWSPQIYKVENVTQRSLWQKQRETFSSRDWICEARHTEKRRGLSLWKISLLRLHPLALHEIDTKLKRSTTEDLLRYGGFPEPFSKKSQRMYRLWKRERLSRVVYQDLRDLDLSKRPFKNWASRGPFTSEGGFSSINQSRGGRFRSIT